MRYCGTSQALGMGRQGGQKGRGQEMSTHDATLEQFKLSEGQAEPMRLSHQKAIERRAMETAGWHNFDDIKTMNGLPGNFVWPETTLLPAAIAFNFVAGTGPEGTYAIGRAGVVVERGRLLSWPNNPFTGWALIRLEPDTGINARMFAFWGLLTDENWRMQLLILSKMVDGRPTLMPFTATRLA